MKIWMISLKFLSLLIDGPTETVKKEIKKQKRGFLDAMMAPMVPSLIAPVSSSLIQPVASSLTNAISEKRVMGAEKEQEDGIIPLLSLSLVMKVLGKRVKRAGKEYSNINHMEKMF